MSFVSRLYSFELFSARSSIYSFIVISLVFVAALFFHHDLGPLEETHWDAPIYVQLSKRVAETNLLAGYHQHAQEIPLGPENAHWYFTRIGHILILGEVTRFLGSSETALIVMQWLYRIFMASGVVLSILIASRLMKLFKSDEQDHLWWCGYLVAGITYVLSDSYRGLQGHLLSEPPAFFFLSVFTYLLLIAIEKRTLVISVLAGFFLFILFFIRIDAVLPGVTFLILVFGLLIFLKKFDTLLSVFASGIVALSFYLLYAWWFSPLVNPQTLLSYSAASKELFPGVPLKSLFAIVIAGGLLWVGSFAGVLLWRKPIVKFALIWLGLVLLPLIIDSLNGRAVQARMVFFIALPLIILAGEGWGWLLRCIVSQRRVFPLIAAVSLTATLILVPYSFLMRDIRFIAANYLPAEIQRNLFISLSKKGEIRSESQPGKDSKLGLLVRPIYERWTLEYDKARKIGEYLFKSEQSAYLLWPRARGIYQHSLQSYIGLFRYFGKNYPSDADIVLLRLPNTIETDSCTAQKPTDIEPIVFCSNLIASDLEFISRNKIPLYILGVDGYPMPEMPNENLRVLFTLYPFTLYGIEGYFFGI